MDWAAEVLSLTNAHRATLGLGPLAPSGALTEAATWKAAHMANYGYFSHDDPQDPTRTWDQRIRDCGYTSGAGENIAYGYRSPQDVVRGWLDSPGHRKNIENATYKVIGVGAAVADDGRPYWVQNFGTKVDATVLDPAPVVSPVEDPTPPPASTTESTPAPTATPDPTPTVTPDSSTPAPVAKDDSITVVEDEVVELDPLANDLVGPGGRLEIVYHEDPRHGTIAPGDGGELTYRPDPDFSGSDTFHYWISDQFGRTCGARITVTVEEANDAPLARRDRARGRPRAKVFIPVTSNDVDVDGDDLLLEGIARSPRFGSARMTGDGVVVYRARRGTKGRTDRVGYRVGDGNGGSAVGVLRIRIRR